MPGALRVRRSRRQGGQARARAPDGQSGKKQKENPLPTACRKKDKADRQQAKPLAAAQHGVIQHQPDCDEKDKCK